MLIDEVNKYLEYVKKEQISKENSMYLSWLMIFLGF